MAAEDPRDVAAAPRKGRYRWLVEWGIILVVALTVAVVMRAFVIETFFIPSPSMVPTLKVGDRILVDKLSYDFHPVHRGDIVVFSRPPLEPPEYQDLVKRVIGLPGDTLVAKDGRVYVDGSPLAEPWLTTANQTGTFPGLTPRPFNLSVPYTVPKGEYFVMGDNRGDSEDSRYFGPIAAKTIVGHVLFVYWPPTGATYAIGGGFILFVLVASVAWASLGGRRRSEE